MSMLVWFRADLRVDDNRALARACAAGGPVSGVFLLSHAQWRAHDWGARRQAFAWRHALALRESLAARGIALWIIAAPRFADAPDALLTLARRIGAGTVIANTEHGVDEHARDRAVEAALTAHGIAFTRCDDTTLLPPGTVRTGDGNAFRVYSPFRRAVLQQVRGQRPRCEAAPPLATPVAPPPLPDWTQPACGIDPDWWPVGEEAARRRLEAFIDERVDDYHVARDIPARDGTSRLSPYLAIGAISIRRCVDAALRHNRGEWDSGSTGATTWLNELLWREFYLHVLVAFPHVSRNQPFKPETARLAWRDAPDELAAWQAGRTGFPLVDAAMRQLAATGWMHNRLRMLSAMFLAKHLLLDWRLGERHFMEQLLDGDLAANNGGWQWSASTGTDAAPYFRLLSPARQAERFDADGAFVRQWVPELARVPLKALLKPGDPALLAAGYPAPIVDTAVARERVLAAFRAL